MNPPLGAIPRTKVRGFYAPRLEGRVQGMENARFIPRPKGRSFRAFFIMSEKLGITNENANDYVEYCYDIFMHLVRAKMLLEGYNASGFGAHEAEVAYIRVLGFNENDVQFANQLRFFRNGMLYYGTRLDKVYAEKVIEFTKQMYLKLKGLIK